MIDRELVLRKLDAVGHHVVRLRVRIPARVDILFWTRILVIQGHPDGGEPHLCHALAASYAKGAADAAHPLRRIRLGFRAE